MRRRRPPLSRSSLAACLALLLGGLLGSCSGAGSGSSPWTGGAGVPAPGQAAAGGLDSPARPVLPVQAGTALLFRGTERVRGLPFLGRNALEALAGAYALAGDGGAATDIDVWYCAEALLIPAAWGPRACPGLPTGFSLREAPPEPALAGIREGYALWMLEANAYRLFISLPVGFADSCRFAAALAERFDWFRRYTTMPSDLSFPALLEYGR